MKKTTDDEYLYNMNDTMKLLGYQYTIDTLNNERFKNIKDVINAYEKHGNSGDKLIAIIYRKNLGISIIWDIFMLGFIHGKREERNKHNK